MTVHLWCANEVHSTECDAQYQKCTCKTNIKDNKGWEQTLKKENKFEFAKEHLLPV